MTSGRHTADEQSLRKSSRLAGLPYLAMSPFGIFAYFRCPTKRWRTPSASNWSPSTKSPPARGPA
jgi:hypothetical protein